MAGTDDINHDQLTEIVLLTLFPPVSLGGSQHMHSPYLGAGVGGS